MKSTSTAAQVGLQHLSEISNAQPHTHTHPVSSSADEKGGATFMEMKTNAFIIIVVRNVAATSTLSLVKALNIPNRLKELSKIITFVLGELYTEMS